MDCRTWRSRRRWSKLRNVTQRLRPWVRPVAKALGFAAVFEVVAALAHSVVLLSLLEGPVFSSASLWLARTIYVPAFIFHKGSTMPKFLLVAYGIAAVVTVPPMWYLTGRKA